jgi:hypothetical protein
MEIEMAKKTFLSRFQRGSVMVLIFAVLLAVVAQSSQMVGASVPAKGNIDDLPGIAAVRASVLAAESLESLPSNLASQLSAENDSRFVDPCESEPDKASQASPAAVACTFGDASSPEVMVLYGDSYAEQFIPAFDALGKADHFKVLVYVRYGCDFANVTDRDWMGTVDPGCATFRNNVISAINRMNPAPSLTLLAEAQFAVQQAPNGSVMSFQTWANGIRSSLTRLQVRPLGVLMGTPAAINTPNTCLARYITRVNACATSLKEAYSATVDKDDVAAIQASHAEAINLSALFCGRTCPSVINDQLVFANSDHIDKSYVATVTTAIGSLVACMGTEVPAAQDPPGGILRSLLGTDASPSFSAACEAINHAPYGLYW